MELVKYTRWPHGATLKVTNRTTRTITCVAEPVLFLQKIPSGWTNTSLSVKTVTAFDPRTLTNWQFFYVSESNSLPKAGDHFYPFSTRRLKPGQSAEFWCRLEPDVLPSRVGTVYSLPPSKLASALQPWVARIRGWTGIKLPQPGQAEVWCPTPLSVSSKPQSAVHD
jgi:hypothetical protein